VAPAILEFADTVIDGRLSHVTSVRRQGATRPGARAATVGSVSSPDPWAGSAAFVRIEQFLPADAHQRVLDFALARENDFTESEVYNEAMPEKLDPHFRRSRTLYDLDAEIWNLFADRLTALLPHVRQELGIPWFRVGEVERQLHVHRGGDFFHRHSDNGEGDVAPRRVSGVYYFYQKPKRFDGGALYLYDDLKLGDQHEGGPSCVALEPLDNSVVFFSSGTYHEVEPVRLRDSAFSAGRFTVTFWFREDLTWRSSVAVPAES
jgi:Rps23 Pro-64 3,4-dihydroxylase Tpa1-like proline 4-hydroxylase